MPYPLTFRRVLSIDPGYTQSAWVLFDPNFPERPIQEHGIVANDAMLSLIEMADAKDILVIEMVAGMGMAVGKEVFETVFWIGRFWQAWQGPRRERLFRMGVKLHLCGQARAKDANIRQALLDRFGSSREIAIGTKKKPGPLYGVSKDVWSALALAMTYCELNGSKAILSGEASS